MIESSSSLSLLHVSCHIGRLLTWLLFSSLSFLAPSDMVYDKKLLKSCAFCQLPPCLAKFLFDISAIEVLK